MEERESGGGGGGGTKGLLAVRVKRGVSCLHIDGREVGMNRSKSTNDE